jgi:hypothetical protein
MADSDHGGGPRIMGAAAGSGKVTKGWRASRQMPILGIRKETAS